MSIEQNLPEVNDKFKPRDYQVPIIDSIISHCRKPNAKPAFVDISVGGGKCLAKDTPIIMYDGSVKMVQDVVCGDQLMSPDSKPRTVSGVTTGREMMYRIDQKRGDSYTVNESHILSLKMTGLSEGRYYNVNGERVYGGDIVNLSITDYLATSKSARANLKGWKPVNGVEFCQDQSDELAIPPYILGVWLGGGASLKPSICNVDDEVISEWYQYAEQIGLSITVERYEGKVNNYYISTKAKGKKNKLTSHLRELGVFGNKHIPKHYLTASKKDRLELLAGIIDTDGYLSKGSGYDIVLKQKSFAKGVEFLVRSLGMWCTARECEKTCTNTGATGTYYRMNIGGDIAQIPCRVARRKAKPSKGCGRGITGITVTKVGVDDYYGFEIEGNEKLFLLGDFTVTHNTAIYAFVADHVISKGGKVMVLARQGELVEQNSAFAWKAGIANSVFSASLKRKSKHYPLIYGTEGTIANEIGEGGKFGYTTGASGEIKYTWVPDLIIFDENHQLRYDDEDNQYMKIVRHFQRANPKLRIIGGTGSPIRGKDYIVGSFWDERLYELSTQKLVNWGWLVPPIFGFPDDTDGYDFSSIEVDKDGNSFSDSELDKIVLENPTKTHKIINEIVARTKERLGVLIFCSTKRHCKEAVEALPEGSYGIITDSTPAKKRREILSLSRAGKIKYLINVGVLATGYNNPYIDTVCYLRPLDSLTLLIQTLGRGLRIPEDDDDFTKSDCLVLDYGDVFARLGDLYENPILETATAEKAKRRGETIPCPKCNEFNSIFARRCIGRDAISQERCDYFFSSRECPECKTENDPCARECRNCKHQLIDPNEKLNGKHYTEKDILDVTSAKAIACKNDGVLLSYTLEDGVEATEFFSPFSQNRIARTIWKSRFVKLHVPKQNLSAFNKLRSSREIVNSGLFLMPKKITHRINDKNQSVINRKVF